MTIVMEDPRAKRSLFTKCDLSSRAASPTVREALTREWTNTTFVVLGSARIQPNLTRIDIDVSPLKL
jgi:hypothetical protein